MYCLVAATLVGGLALGADLGFRLKGALLTAALLFSAFGIQTFVTGSWVRLRLAKKKAEALARSLHKEGKLRDVTPPVRMADHLTAPQLTDLYLLARAESLPSDVDDIGGLDWHLFDLWIIASESHKAWAMVLRDTLALRNPRLKIGFGFIREGESAEVFCRVHCGSGSRKCIAFISAELVGTPIGKMQMNDALTRHLETAPGGPLGPYLRAVPMDDGGREYMNSRASLKSYATTPVAQRRRGPNPGVIRNLVEVLEEDFRQSDEQPERPVFVSYAHKDSKWLDDMTSAISEDGLKVVPWDDRQLKEGQEFEHEIFVRLVAAEAAVFLVSKAFLSSNFIREKEMGNVMQLAQAEHLKIFWLLVSEGDVLGSGIERYQAIHSPTHPLSEMSEDDRNTVWQKLKNAIHRHAAGLD